MLGEEEVERFRDLIGRRLGLQFDDGKLGFLAEVCLRRMERNETDARDYLSRLAEPDQSEWRALTRELTVTETYFFRNQNQFRALVEHVLPERMESRSSVRRMNFLSAGCASGDEPYSMAILLNDAITDPSWSISILGVDGNPAMLDAARAGRVTQWALRETPAEVRDRWFRADGRHFVLDQAVRDRVSLKEFNLAAENADLWRREFYDVVFFRNVLMYFTPECARAILWRVAHSLVPGGYLFLGHAETLRGLSKDFHLVHTHGTFYYQRAERLNGADSTVATKFPNAKNAGVEPARLEIPAIETDWYDAIGLAAERVRSLSAQRKEGRGPETRKNARPPKERQDAPNIGTVLDLVQSERFAEALELVRALADKAAAHPDIGIIEALLLTQCGQFAEAERLSKSILEADGLNAAANYILALCREAAGDLIGAVEFHEIAAHLDDGFAMPLLHIGLIARRTGDIATARRALSTAEVLLQREDAGRILLFGGGFGREALLALGRAEFAECERVKP